MWDLSDANLDLLDKDIPSKHFVYLQYVLKTSSRHVIKTSSRPRNVCWDAPDFILGQKKYEETMSDEHHFNDEIIW